MGAPPWPGASPSTGEISGRRTRRWLRGGGNSGQGHVHIILAFEFSFFTCNSPALLESYYCAWSREEITFFLSSLRFFWLPRGRALPPPPVCSHGLSSPSRGVFQGGVIGVFDFSASSSPASPTLPYRLQLYNVHVLTSR